MTAVKLESLKIQCEISWQMISHYNHHEERILSLSSEQILRFIPKGQRKNQKPKEKKKKKKKKKPQLEFNTDG